MNTAVVIVTYNRLKLLKECLSCVNNQEIPFSRIIIVNNASSDGTREYLDGCGHPGYEVLHLSENLGGAGGFYEGMKAAMGSDWILLIDDDAMLSPDFMKKMLAASEGQAALSACVVTDGRIDISHHRRIKSRLIFEERPVEEGEYHKDFFCDTATFCGFMIRGDMVEEIGLPKKEYFIWCDDTEYCLRLYKRGQKILVVKDALLDHRTTLSVDKGSLLMRIEEKSYYGYRNRYDAARLHIGRLTAAVILLEYRIFWLCSLLFSFSPDENRRAQGEFNQRLLSDVICDCKAGRLGKREGYLH